VVGVLEGKYIEIVRLFVLEENHLFVVGLATLPNVLMLFDVKPETHLLLANTARMEMSSSLFAIEDVILYLRDV
jgi:hypothetical protein